MALLLSLTSIFAPNIREDDESPPTTADLKRFKIPHKSLRSLQSILNINPVLLTLT